MTMKILIIEDETRAAHRLQKLVNDYFVKSNVYAEFYEVLDSISTAITFFQQGNATDLVFLDIQLSDGISFEIFNEIHLQTPVIFTTAYDEYALKAFQVHSIDYLLKPIEEQALERSLEKFTTLRALFANTTQNSAQVQALPQANAQDIQGLLQTLATTHKTYKSRFLVQTATGYVSIDVADIAYFVSEHKVSWLITNSAKRYSVDFSLEDLYSLLNPTHFFRANRQYILHIQSIQNIFNSFNGKLKIVVKPNAPDEIIIGREKASQFKEWLDL
ncbi:MAG: DNA-binding response regulator [Candidatus Kapaibacterium sp.]|nr:MAG: DNA-binding response regulator [Candidatus Kapabacteria bacterium]